MFYPTFLPLLGGIVIKRVYWFVRSLMMFVLASQKVKVCSLSAKFHKNLTFQRSRSKFKVKIATVKILYTLQQPGRAWPGMN